MKNTTVKYRRIFERLKQLKTRLQLTEFAEGLVFALGFLGLITGSILALEIVLKLPPPGRIFLSGIFILASGFFLLRGVIYPLVGRRFSLSAEKLALMVGKKFPDIKDHLSNALQLYTQLEKNPKGYSTDLTIAALEEVNDTVDPIDFNTVVDYSKFKRNLRFAGIVLGVFLLLISFFSTQFGLAARRLWHPTASFAEITRYGFDIQPGNIRVTRGDDVTLSASIKSNEFIENAQLIITNLTTGQTNEWYLHASGNGPFQYTVSNVTDSLRYAIRANEQTSPEYKISVIELPLVRNLQLKLDYPGYTRLPARFLDENVGDIAAIRGTRVALALKSSKELDSATVVFGTGHKQSLETDGFEATGAFILKQSTHYLIWLTDPQGLKNQDPIQYGIEVLEDHYPTIKITAPANDVDVTGDMRLIILADAEDDFGFSRAELHYRVNRPKSVATDKDQFFHVPIKNPNSEKIALNFDWDLRELKLQPSDWVEYYFEIFDNDEISGPKSARSLSYTLRFPSVNEMYEEMAVQQETTDENLEQVLEKSQELREKIDQIMEEMKKDPQLSWEEKKNIEEALDSQKKLTQKLEEVQKNLEDLVERIEKNNLLSPETLEKYQELQELFEKIATPEMKEAMADLQQALENIDPQQIQEAMEKMDFNQESFLKNIERTIELLKRLQIEQKFDEIINKAEDLARRQDELNQSAKDAPPEQSQQFAEEQQALLQENEQLKQLMQELQAQMGELPNMPRDEVQKAQEMAAQNALEQMQQAMQQFQQGQMQSASQAGEKSQQSLKSLAQMMRDIKQQMGMQHKQEVLQALQKAAHELLSYSKEQESLMEQSRQTSVSSPKYNALPEKQLDMLRSLARTTEDMLALSKKTFFVTPEMGRALGASINNMRGSLEELESRNMSSAAQHQGRAMTALNQAVGQLQGAMNNLSNASSGTGMEQLMQQLQASAQKQQGVNLQTQELGQAGKLSLAQQAALSRLAAEQRQLQKTLEELNQEFGGKNEILGNLDQIGKEMGEAAKELAAQPQVQPKTVQRQQRILSRLLDAQRSMRTRDFSEERESESGKNYLPRHVELPQNLGEQKLKLQDDLLKALKEGYARDYRELIKKYFDALSEGMQHENIE
jgi:hypothetical protein